MDSAGRRTGFRTDGCSSRAPSLSGSSRTGPASGTRISATSRGSGGARSPSTGRGNVYVNTINFDFGEFNEVLGSGKALGKIALVTPDGEVREVANDLSFPNGMVITPDNRTLVVAESFAARLTAFEMAFAAMLGGPERRSLFMLTADWRGTEGVEDVITATTGQVLVVEAPAPGVGWP